ncbi:succinyl-diaminopimelate desuccinylase [Roseobacter sp. HKCCD9010]|uniref:succinyl-diaminopimelate desuccinylase n=1 Tax=unclassified Roseobacter TaxID=196798 RepID=UPI00149127C3|nr:MULTISPECIES: succinyl-diaminopimelate desuccinylase [unclassified Roseobacter]MBF9051117.1 succinyl-diaminopimelate desuccinylase [Rhodobacterales bacterium HKCCD4356]NNV12886.1 succinyl-diaminopimelate desuccinylase [Roseobacter sp. HKCCD7357]NNV16831.1 succinyl-diaminopimelate desuccinylase [Roseobacter sp. HKCCD8768]NNV26537.1 succinyl-diaminopimelate desuccinylase [Roseobacter sp. HKCCD8192]NNV30552.1 succinyl-diaminopimelate desuccinylase [Roseobacter sp. HKCCD9061]
MTDAIDPQRLTADLIRCPSVTPEEGGALHLLQDALADAGFISIRVDRNSIPNLFARWGGKGHAKTLGFNGHTDVVPVGDEAAWTHPPFGAEEADGWLYGRGATDMKSGVAAFVAAAIDFVRDTPPDGAIILAITGDEEGTSTDGTIAILDWMAEEGEAMAACIVGEPTSLETIGDMIKIGRRGSMTAFFTVTGKQGHSAYLDRALNPMPAVALLAHRLSTHTLDEGTDHFDPSTCAVTTIDTGNTASNVIPAQTRMTANLRFNDTHSGASLTDWLQSEANKVAAETGTTITMEVKISGEPFLTPPGPLSDLVAHAVTVETGQTPTLSTTGGTSDARFVKSHCPVVEFGLVGHRMHQVDERAWIQDIHDLKRVYARVLTDYFA